MVTAAIRFVRTFETGRLSPDVYHTQPKPEWFDSVMEKIPVETRTEVAKRCGAYPLDMSQLNAMFRFKCVLTTTVQDQTHSYLTMRTCNSASCNTCTSKSCALEHMQVDEDSKARHGRDRHTTNCLRALK